MTAGGLSIEEDYTFSSRNNVLINKKKTLIISLPPR